MGYYPVVSCVERCTQTAPILKVLIPIQDVYKKHSRELIPLECEICGRIFFKCKSLVLRGLKGTRKVSVCGNDCRKKLLSNALMVYYSNPPTIRAETKHQRIKAQLVESLGGKCEMCGYNRSQSALSFHHKDPKQKDFTVCSGLSRKMNIDDLLKEVKKCRLVCSNCHHEIHDGLVRI